MNVGHREGDTLVVHTIGVKAGSIYNERSRVGHQNKASAGRNILDRGLELAGIFTIPALSVCNAASRRAAVAWSALTRVSISKVLTYAPRRTAAPSPTPTYPTPCPTIVPLHPRSPDSPDRS